MVTSTMEFPEKENRILNIVKGQHGFKNKAQANIFIIQQYGEMLEPQLKPSFIKEMKKIRKQKHHSFKNIKDLKKQIEN